MCWKKKLMRREIKRGLIGAFRQERMDFFGGNEGREWL